MLFVALFRVSAAVWGAWSGRTVESMKLTTTTSKKDTEKTAVFSRNWGDTSEMNAPTWAHLPCVLCSIMAVTCPYYRRSNSRREQQQSVSLQNWRDSTVRPVLA